MTIVLTALAWILYIILAIIGIFILILLVVLFVPIKYKLEICKNNEDTRAIGKVTWFFRVLSVSFNSKQDPNTTIRILGYKLKSKPSKKDMEDIKEDEDIEKEEPPPLKEETEKELGHKEEKKSFSQNKKIILNNIEYGKKIAGKMYNYPNKRQIMNLTADLGKNIIKKLKPKYFALEGEIGLGPFETGISFGLLSFVLPVIINWENINLTGNFQEEVLNFNVQAKGKFMGWYLAGPTLKYLFKKPIRKLIVYSIKTFQALTKKGTKNERF